MTAFMLGTAIRWLKELGLVLISYALCSCQRSLQLPVETRRKAAVDLPLVLFKT